MSEGLAELFETPAQTRALTPFDRVFRVDATSTEESVEAASILLQRRAEQAATNVSSDSLCLWGWLAPPLVQPFYPHWRQESRSDISINYRMSDTAHFIRANTWDAMMPNAGAPAMMAYAMGRYCSSTIARDDLRSHTAELCRDIRGRIGGLTNIFLVTGTVVSLDLVNAAVTASLIASTAGIILSSAAVHNPLPQLEETRQQCLAILNRAEGSLRRDVVESIKRQLSSLLDAAEWEAEDRKPSVTSFSHLVAFLAKHNELAAPSLTVSNGANFVASYLKTRQNIVRLEFDTEGWAKWLVYLAPITGRSEKGTATISADKVKKALEPFSVWEWMSQQ